MMARTDRLLTACILAALLSLNASCGDVQSPNAAAVASAEEAVTESSSENLLTFGDEAYEMDFTVCIPGPVATLIATDRKKRSTFPMIRVAVYDTALDGGPVESSVSVDFSRSEPRVYWMLHEGVVEKREDRFVASGTLRGQKMVKNSSGIERPVKLEDRLTKPFRLDLSC